jgi:hypothetical protein
MVKIHQDWSKAIIIIQQEAGLKNESTTGSWVKQL